MSRRRLLMNIRFPGKRVPVTGTALGIGHRIAHVFAEEGAETYAKDIKAGFPMKVVRKTPRPLSTHALDVTDSAAGRSDRHRVVL